MAEGRKDGRGARDVNGVDRGGDRMRLSGAGEDEAVILGSDGVDFRENSWPGMVVAFGCKEEEDEA